MKKIFSFFAAILMVTALTSMQKAETTAVGKKVTICHRTGNGSSHTIVVSINALQAHLNHGDKVGDCIPVVNI